MKTHMDTVTDDFYTVICSQKKEPQCRHALGKRQEGLHKRINALIEDLSELLRPRV